jgi:hypothetical protein
LEAFRRRGLKWPVDWDAVAASKDIVFKRWGLPDRPAELLYFLHVAFPFDMKEAAVEFVDVNPSMGRLLPSEQSTSPWRTTCPTLTGLAIVCVRYLGPGSSVVVRPITPIESFALIGWGVSYFRSPIDCTASCVLNMAGNAFSGFAFSPVLMMALTGCGVISTMNSDTLRSCCLTAGAPAVADAESESDPGEDSQGSVA